MAARGYITREIRRHHGDAVALEIDHVAEEVPVALVYNGISHAVMMATPLDLEAFAVGFSLTEGIAGSVGEIYEVEIESGCDGIEVRLEISQRAFMAMKERRRTLAGRTGCGVCGIESLALLDLVPEPLASVRNVAPTAATIRNAADALRTRQPLMAATGGVHAAAWCGADGQLHAVFEDVGRHNALDKLIGHLARARESFGDGFVFLSSRASYELVRKAARMQIPLLATISAPTSLAIRIAEQAGVRLLSFCRQDGFVEYTSPGNVLASEPLVAAG